MRVPRPVPERPSLPSDDLALTAMRFAAGELSPADTTEFAARIADDPQARDALEEAFRLSAAVLGQPVPSPDPVLRAQVHDRLSADPLTRLFPRRPYRGHPLTWATVGGLLAAGLTVFGVWLGDPPRSPSPARIRFVEQPSPEIPTNDPVTTAVAPRPERQPEVIVSVEPATPTVFVEVQPTIMPMPGDALVATEGSPTPSGDTATVPESAEARPGEPKAVIGNEIPLPGQ